MVPSHSSYFSPYSQQGGDGLPALIAALHKKLPRDHTAAADMLGGKPGVSPFASDLLRAL
jgi:hypothetical protein